jgi:hypothetical protein
MLALTLYEESGIFAGILFLIVGLVLVLRPLNINVTVRHRRDHGSDTEED